MTRLFTFGCSFTQYYWPTWADILGREYDFFENWGKLGGGNVYIATSIVEAAIRNKFTKDDTVMIMWSNMMREDRYLPDTYWENKRDNWLTFGNIYNKKTYTDFDQYVQNFVTVRGFYFRDLTQMYLTAKLLDSIGCKYEFMSMVDLVNPDQFQNLDASEKIGDLLDFYKYIVDKVRPSVHKVIFTNDWLSRPLLDMGRKRVDCHPIPSEHLEYIETVFPNIHISDDTREWVKMVDVTAKKFVYSNEKHTMNTYYGWKEFDNTPSNRL